MDSVFYRERALEALSRKVLLGYDPNFLVKPPQAVPIEQIIEKKFNLSIDIKFITNNGRILGKTVFDDGYTPYYNTEKHDYDFLKVTAGTIVVDARLLEAKHYGRLRFTYAHELAHWLIHKKIYSGTGEVAAQLFDEHDDANEWQANALATYILMPAGPVKRCYYSTIPKTFAKDNILTDLANVFCVSKQAMGIRLHSLGLM